MRGADSTSHQDRVRAVAAQLAARPAGSKVTIRKTTPSHSIRDSGYKTACHAVDVSSLREILHIDPDNRRALVEGQVLVGDLSKARGFPLTRLGAGSRANAARLKGSRSFIDRWRARRSFIDRWKARLSAEPPPPPR